MADDYEWQSTGEILAELKRNGEATLQTMREATEKLRKENQELREKICLLRQDLVDLRNRKALGIITEPGVKVVVEDVTRTITPASCRYDEAMKVVK